MLMTKGQAELKPLKDSDICPSSDRDFLQRLWRPCLKHLALKMSSPWIPLITSYFFLNLAVASTAQLPSPLQVSVLPTWHRSSVGCPSFAGCQDRGSHQMSTMRWMVPRLISFTAELLLSYRRESRRGSCVIVLRACQAARLQN